MYINLYTRTVLLTYVCIFVCTCGYVYISEMNSVLLLGGRSCCCCCCSSCSRYY